ncbi:MAG: CDGSH iron-sulfur domain-containing protein [Verrucomicrobiae bacterium]|nr:CDGSH iron-sulfur domain-containing protein [Verrucomicrobiae bacterium]
MEDPENDEKQPQTLNLEAGDYWWCTCGSSEALPFCDGSHKGTGLGPLKFTLEKGKSIIFDGQHRKSPSFSDSSPSQP